MAAMLAGIITYFFSKRMRASRAQHATTGIVAAVNDMPSGATLTAKDVALVDWPTNLTIGRVLRQDRRRDRQAFALSPGGQESPS